MRCVEARRSGGNWNLPLTHDDALNLFQQLSDWVPIDADGNLQLGLQADHPDTRPCVYAWVEQCTGGARRILYIGKAGKGLIARMKQHRAGFKKSVTGQTHALALRDVLMRGSTLSIWALYPEPFEMFGHLIPSHSAIEDYLIANVKPRPERNHYNKRLAAPALSGDA